MNDDQQLWLERCAAEGLSVPNWPSEYGGAGFSKEQYVQFHEEMHNLGVRAPVSGGANFADWIFCLVRTDPDAPKHEGISFLLFSMDQPGISARPIRLISGASPFCETFFTDAIAKREDLVSEENKGWTVAKRLLQHERSGIQALASGGGSRKVGVELPELGHMYSIMEDDIAPSIRPRVCHHLMNAQAMSLTQRRTVEESEGNTPGPATSIFKYYGANLAKERCEIQMSITGTSGLGQSGDEFSHSELDITRNWLATKASSIAGVSNEVQLNIVAKRVLVLPD